MNFKDLQINEKKKYANLMFQKLNSPEELKNWIMFFLGLDFPIGIVDPDSNSSPIEAMWEIYNIIKENRGDEIPGVIMLSARECYKTLGASILEVILMLQFRTTIAHMAAIREQSAKAVQYINLFFTKIEPLLEVSGWEKTSENKTKISFRTEYGEDVYIRVIVATMAGANCVDPSSIVMVNGRGQIPAVEVTPGDKILTRNYKTGLDEYVTSKGMQIATKSARKLTLESGRSLIVSDDHPIFTDSGWIRSSQVRIGSKVITNTHSTIGENPIKQEDSPKRSLDQLILGTLLGDASIHRIPSGKVRYSVYHCEKQKEYIDIIANIFVENGINVNICKDDSGYKLTSVTSPLLSKYYDLAIDPVTKKKTVTKEWLNLLNYEGIAYWLMDDGHGNAEKVGSKKEHRIDIATCGFTQYENELISDFFQSFGYKNRITTATNQSSKRYPQISLDLRSSRILSENIKFYFIKSLKYKLLSSLKEATQRWALDTGEIREVSYIRHKTLFWDKNPNLKEERLLKKRIIEQFNDSVKHIELLGYIDLVDIAIDSEDKTLHSFYANGILVHNSEHTSLMFIDEIDVVANPLAYEEAKLIPGYTKGIHPVTVKLSTRKFAFGLMQKEIDMAPVSGDKIVRWNILDVCERCPESRHKPELPKYDMYTARSLPLRSISVEEYNLLPDTDKSKWEFQPGVYSGCIDCKLLPVCKTALSKRAKEAVGGLYKPISAVLNSFKKIGPDMAEAQLLCFGKNTQVLMGNGISKNISDINVGDEVISHTGKIQKVTEVFKRQYSGEVFKVQNDNWRNFEPTIVTPEHPYFINGNEFNNIENIRPFKFTKDGGLKEAGDYLSLPIYYQESGLCEIKYEDYVKKPLKHKDGKVKINSSTGRYVPSTFKLNREFGWILGYFLAEGFYSRRTYSTDRRLTNITFCSDERETEYHENVRNFANLCNLTVSEFKAKDGYGYTIDIYNNSLAELFFVLCGEYSDKKVIHKDLMNANIEFLHGILDGFDAGDGTKRRNSYRELTTTSYLLASQLFVISARLGLCPRIKRAKTPEGSKQAHRVMYQDSTYINKQKRTKYIVGNGYNLYRLDSLEKTDYEGFVYNIEVEEDNSYIANGVAVHNCWKPSSRGMVYPRFDGSVDRGNVISLKQAWTTLIGEVAEGTRVTELDLLDEMKKLEIPFYAGVDWGYTHDFVIVIMAMLPNGEVWVIDCYSESGLEFSDCLEIAKSFRDKYVISKWFADQAMPANIKSFTKNGMKSPKFTKDVMGGIESLRFKILNGSGQRMLKVLNTDNNQKVINAFQKHYFKLGTDGNPTLTPDDTPGVSDQADALRYLGQNLFPVKGPQKPGVSWTETEKFNISQDPQNTNQMKNEILKRIGPGGLTISNGKKGGFHFNF